MLCSNNSHLSSSLQNLANLLTTEKILPLYSLKEVSLHDNFDDCWIILFDNVYDITEFIQHHPGGETILLDNAGRDATFVFFSVGHGVEQMAVLDKYLVGRLPDEQKLFPYKEAQK